MSWRAIRWAMGAMQEARLSSVQRLVLITLAYHHHDKTGACTPSVETLAGETGLSRRAVQLATKELANTGMITLTARSVHGIQTSNQHDLFGSIKGRTKCTRGGARNGIAGVHQVHPNLSNLHQAEGSNITRLPICGSGAR